MLKKYLDKELPPPQLIEPSHFDVSSGRWSFNSNESKLIEEKELRIVTYNVWFDPSDFEISNGETFRDYGELLLSKFPIKKLFVQELHSLQERKCLFAELFINNEKIGVSTVHLESRDFDGFSVPLRQDQLKTIFSIMSSFDSVIFCGDFNFCSTQVNEQKFLLQEGKNYVDVWEKLHPNEDGATIGVNFKKPRSKPSRYDRVLLKSSVLKPASIIRLGEQPIGGVGKQIFTSDHLGLFASFLFEAQISSKQEI